MLIHYETKGNLMGLGFNLYAYTLPELIAQAKKNSQYQFINYIKLKQNEFRKQNLSR